MQLYVPVRETSAERTSGYAKDLAQRLEAEHPDLVVSRMTKSLRPGKVFVDWSQNNGAKTTVAPYSLRARPEADRLDTGDVGRGGGLPGGRRPAVHRPRGPRPGRP